MKDAIVVLAGGVNKDGSLPDLPKKRVERGVELFKAHKAPKIIMSGKYGFWLDYYKDVPPRSEAEAMKEYAVSLGVLEESIILEDTSKDTVGNAYFTKVNILEKNNWKKVIVVTSEFHLERTKFIFDTVLGPEYEIEYSYSEDGLSQLERESVKQKEEKTIKTIKDTILNVAPGDSEKIGKLLFSMHPGYAKNPQITFEKLREMLGRG